MEIEYYNGINVNFTGYKCHHRENNRGRRDFAVIVIVVIIVNTSLGTNIS